MRTHLLALGLVSASAASAADDSYFTVTCTSQMVERASGRVEMVYDRTRGGSSLEEARELAEDNVMEICAMDAFRFNYQDSHACRLVGCE